MARKVFLIALAATAIGIGMLVPQLAASEAGAGRITVDEATRQQILQATVRITILAPALDENGEPGVTIVDGQKQTEYVAGNGLGTLLRSGEETLIATHDHWKLLERPESVVELSSAGNELLLTISGQEFRRMIRYRDGGTLLVSAPAGLADSFQATSSGQPQSVKRGEILYIAYRQTFSGDAISVEPVAVKRLQAFEGRPVYQLESANGQTVQVGNSGGGVWHNGELVGNVWASVLMSGSKGVRETSVSRAAQLPAGF